MKLNPFHLGTSIGAALAIMYLAYSVLVALLPRNAVMHLYSAFAHGMDWNKVVVTDSNPVYVACGTFGWFVLGLNAGAITAGVYNRLQRRSL